MKRLLLCILILCGIVGFSLWGVFQTKSFKEEFSSSINEALELKNKENSALAYQKTKEAVDLWERYEKKISYAVDNSNLKRIGEIISQLEYSALNADSESFNLLCIVAKENISRLLFEEIPTFEAVV